MSFIASILSLALLLGETPPMETPTPPQVTSSCVSLAPAPLPTPSPEPVPDRTKPIYEVYKDGWEVEVSAEVQWIIRDFAEKYDFDEKLIFGCCLAESCFEQYAGLSTGSQYRGLTQIGTYWIYTDTIPRFEENSADRDLFDPYDNILTLMELWSYARDTFDIDTSTEQGKKDLLYFHNTGDYWENVDWRYSNKIIGYADELVEIEY